MNPVALFLLVWSAFQAAWDEMVSHWWFVVALALLATGCSHTLPLDKKPLDTRPAPRSFSWAITDQVVPPPPSMPPSSRSEEFRWTITDRVRPEPRPEPKPIPKPEPEVVTPGAGKYPKMGVQEIPTDKAADKPVPDNPYPGLKPKFVDGFWYPTKDGWWFFRNNGKWEQKWKQGEGYFKIMEQGVTAPAAAKAKCCGGACGCGCQPTTTLSPPVLAPVVRYAAPMIQPVVAPVPVVRYAAPAPLRTGASNRGFSAGASFGSC